MRTKIKICGLRTEEDIRAVNEVHPDYAGFILFPGSRRYVTDPQLERIPMEIGYKSEKGKAHFEPLHPELYETLPALPCVLLRTTTYTPLALDKKLLQPIEEALRREGMCVGGDLYAHIHAVQKTEKGNLYFITARQTAEKIV